MEGCCLPSRGVRAIGCRVVGGWEASVNHLILCDLWIILGCPLFPIRIPEGRQKLRDNSDLRPWNVSQWNWDQYSDLNEMIEDRVKLHDDPVKVREQQDIVKRIFHPKKSGYKFFADEWMKKILANHA